MGLYKSVSLEDVKFSYNKLRARMVEFGFNQKTFAAALGINENSLASKLNGKAQFKQIEIFNACNLLEIKQEDIGLYFFTRELPQLI